MKKQRILQPGQGAGLRLRRQLFRQVLFACLSFPLAADSISFTALPPGGSVSGPAGSTVGWGYSITNNSAADWFVSTGLNPDSSFLGGTPTLLFGFPDVAPGATAMETFDPVNGIGLYEFAWDLSAPAKDTNSGNFVLSGQWWGGDPVNGGNFIANAVDTSAAYSATVSSNSSSAPEPSSVVMMWGGLGILIFQKKARMRIRNFV